MRGGSLSTHVMHPSYFRTAHKHDLSTTSGLQDEHGVWRNPSEARYIARALVGHSGGQAESAAAELSVIKTL